MNPKAKHFLQLGTASGKLTIVILVIGKISETNLII